MTALEKLLLLFEVHPIGYYLTENFFNIFKHPILFLFLSFRLEFYSFYLFY